MLFKIPHKMSLYWTKIASRGARGKVKALQASEVIAKVLWPRKEKRFVKAAAVH